MLIVHVMYTCSSKPYFRHNFKIHLYFSRHIYLYMNDVEIHYGDFCRMLLPFYDNKLMKISVRGERETCSGLNSIGAFVTAQDSRNN